MKRARAASVVAAIAAAFAVPASALAYTDNGSVAFQSGRACSGCTVTFHNLSTGAYGSTTSNSSGAWSAGGFVSGYFYEVYGNYNLGGGCTYGSADSILWQQGSYNMLIGTIHVNSHAGMSGCPVF